MTDTAPIRIPLADITADMTDRHYGESLVKFTADTRQHVMEVAHDDDVYRHLRFSNPDGFAYWFDITTSPGLITLNGDVGTFVFSRIHDMLEFFSGRSINPRYWGEKLRASSAYQSYSRRMFKQLVNERLAEHAEDEGWPEAVLEQLRIAIDSQVLHHDETDADAHTALREFDWSYTTGGETYRFSFYDTWEWDLKDYDIQFLWACHAIRAAVRAYARHELIKAERDQPAEVAGW